MITSIDTEKEFDKIPHPFMIKNSQQIKNGGKLPQFDKEYLPKNLQLMITLNDETRYCPVKIRNKAKVSALPFLFNIVLEALGNSLRQVNKRKKKNCICSQNT